MEIKGLQALFTRHPAAVGETYGEHLVAAGGFGARLVLAGLACLVHALLPCLFQFTASDCVHRLHDTMSRRRARAGSGSPGSSVRSHAPRDTLASARPARS